MLEIKMLEIKTTIILTESIISFEIFSEHLWLVLKFKNGYLCHVTKFMTLSG